MSSSVIILIIIIVVILLVVLGLGLFFLLRNSEEKDTIQSATLPFAFCSTDAQCPNSQVCLNGRCSNVSVSAPIVVNNASPLPPQEVIVSPSAEEITNTVERVLAPRIQSLENVLDNNINRLGEIIEKHARETRKQCKSVTFSPSIETIPKDLPPPANSVPVTTSSTVTDRVTTRDLPPPAIISKGTRRDLPPPPIVDNEEEELPPPRQEIIGGEQDYFEQFLQQEQATRPTPPITVQTRNNIPTIQARTSRNTNIPPAVIIPQQRNVLEEQPLRQGRVRETGLGSRSIPPEINNTTRTEKTVRGWRI